MFEVECLLDKRTENGVLQYYVKWLGYPEEDCTWENASDLDCGELIRLYESTHGPDASPASRDEQPVLAKVKTEPGLVEKPVVKKKERDPVPVKKEEAEAQIVDAADDLMAGEQAFEVEAIRKKRIRDGVVEYYIKWLGYPEEDSTWEQAKDLDCDLLIQKYESEHPSDPKRPVRKVAEEIAPPAKRLRQTVKEDEPEVKPEVKPIIKREMKQEPKQRTSARASEPADDSDSALLGNPFKPLNETISVKGPPYNFDLGWIPNKILGYKMDGTKLFYKIGYKEGGAEWVPCEHVTSNDTGVSHPLLRYFKDLLNLLQGK